MTIATPRLPIRPFEGTPILPPVARTAAAPGLLARRLIDRGERIRALLAWNRNLARPANCTHVPDRQWRRHSALLMLTHRPPGQRREP